MVLNVIASSYKQTFNLYLIIFAVTYNICGFIWNIMSYMLTEMIGSSNGTAHMSANSTQPNIFTYTALFM